MVKLNYIINKRGLVLICYSLAVYLKLQLYIFFISCIRLPRYAGIQTHLNVYVNGWKDEVYGLISAFQGFICERQLLFIRFKGGYIALHPLDNLAGFGNTYWLDNDLSTGYQYPTFEELRPNCLLNVYLPFFSDKFKNKRYIHTVIINNFDFPKIAVAWW